MTLPLLFLLFLLHSAYLFLRLGGVRELPFGIEFAVFLLMLLWQSLFLWRSPPGQHKLEDTERNLLVTSTQASLQAGIMAGTIFLTVGMTALGFLYMGTGTRPVPPLTLAHFSKAVLWAGISVVAGVWSLFSIPTQALQLDIRTNRTLAVWVYVTFDALMVAALRMIMGILSIG